MLLLELAGLCVIAGLLLHGGGSPSGFDGFVYLESNTAAPGGNAVLAYRFRGGHLGFLGSYLTGGTGTVDPGETGALDAVGQVVADPARRLLFVVNQGSDTVSAFHISTDGRLDPVVGSPYSARGTAPAGLALDGDLLLVDDKAADPARQLDQVRPEYAAFRIGHDGHLSPGGTSFTTLAGSSPTQVLPIGESVVSTEETGPFRIFRVTRSGSFSEAADSPLAPAGSIFPTGYDGARWAIGLAAVPEDRLVYANQAATAQLLVYSYNANGLLTFRKAVANRGAKLPCWTAVSRDGSHLFTANAGNGTVSSFDLSGPDAHAPRQLQTLALNHGANPWGLALDPSGHTLFVVDARAIAGLPADVGNRLHVLRVSAGGQLSELTASGLPVGADSSPLGIAVVPRS